MLFLSIHPPINNQNKFKTISPFSDGPLSRLLLHTASRHAGMALQIYWGLSAAADAAASGLGVGGAAHAQAMIALQAAVLASGGGRLRWMVLNQQRTGNVQTEINFEHFVSDATFDCEWSNSVLIIV